MNTDPIPPEERRLLGLALASLEQKDYARATANLHALLAMDARHELAIGMLAAAHAEQGQTDLAAQGYERVLGINPANPLARFQLGMLRFLKGEYEPAIDIWRELLEEPADFMAHFHSGLALLKLDRADEAAPLLKHAAAHMPADHPLAASAAQLLQSL